MPRNVLPLGAALVVALTAACSGGPAASEAPAPAPAETPETPASEPAVQPEPATDAGAEPGSGDRPEVILEDGRDLMDLSALPPRDMVPEADVPAGDLTTADAVFTLEQAARGAELVKSTCSECHDPEDWRERGFLGRWSGESTYQLWYYINDRMPYRNPWSLSRQQVTDALAYILYVNELPAGDEEMGTTEDDIDDYWIVWDTGS